MVKKFTNEQRDRIRARRAWTEALYERESIIREKAVERYLVDQVEALDGLCMKFASPGRRGVPDRIVVLHGRPSFYVELKSPRRGRLTPAQTLCHKRLRDRGQRVWVLRTKEDIDAFLTEVTFT